MSRHSLILGTWLALSVPATALAATRTPPDTLADTTVVRSWLLDNGLRVVARELPKALATAVTVGYSIGTDDDPPGRLGLVQVLVELEFTAATADFPERTREDLDSQRPLGWSYPVSRRTTLLTEVAAQGQLPGVLQQVASRMRGVQVSQEGLATAVKNAQKEMKGQLSGSGLGPPYYQVREVAMGHKDDAIAARASGRDLDKLTVAEASRAIQKMFVPANAVVSLAGDLHGIDVEALTAHLFGDIPAGQRFAHSRPLALAAQSRTLRLAGIAQPSGVVGVIAPALDDTLHPSFYLNALLLGSHFNHLWLREDEGRAPNRWHYAVFDEPDLMRIFPLVDSGTVGADALGASVEAALNTFSQLIVTTEPYEAVRSDVAWMLGGPMPPTVSARAPRDPSLLQVMARTGATRALWGGEAFWSAYRHRFETERPGHLGEWLAYFKDPKHQVRLLMLPAAKPKQP
jgi:predicted Zn-dependent peptidase